MSELKPCPFCGATFEIWCDKHRTWALAKHRPGCFFPSKHNHEIPEYDFDAWNTRAERTCTQIDVTDTRKPYTTHMTECSECGGVLALDEYRAPNYCPQCGAKVER